MTGKISGKFYPLTPRIAQTLRQAKLTAAEWRIWSYLVEVDPHGDRYVDIDTLDVTSKCDCSQATFYRALATFKELRLFDFQDKGWSFKNENGASKMRIDSQNCESILKNEKKISRMRMDSQDCKNKTPKSLSGKASNSPQTIQTYSDFKDSLSEEERESFESFCRNEVAGLPRPVVSLQDYLAAGDASGQPRYLDFYRRFAGTTVAAQIRTQQAADALTEELYQQFDREFRAMDCEYMDFVKDCPHRSPEWELRVKFLEEWDRRNNAVPLL